jgi:3-hydroxyisobutyrate dehydrogenase-like beta-hydroxyacid dehydrogenase
MAPYRAGLLRTKERKMNMVEAPVYGGFPALVKGKFGPKNCT